MSTDAPATPTAAPPPRGWRSKRKWKRARKVLARVLKFADIPLGTLGAFVPPALAVQEFKEVLEGSLES